MDANTILAALWAATKAETPEDKARVGWRFNDALWWTPDTWPLARALNNELQDMKLPWVAALWTKDEVRAAYKARGWADEQLEWLK